MADIDQLRADLADYQAAEKKLLTGGMVTDAWREGRRLRFASPFGLLQGIRDRIRDVQQQIAALDPTSDEAVNRRRPVRPYFS